ncbi:hypothetical protein [Alcanivorax sp. S71-1-4]|uniref:hypothetical protein n=1 Tax=Alcanivorax sp. S71-1-4 TaxID=1177159 RepID=UPI001358C9A0|nr:hypothetical protein [Alcanivorax sp. S71-1-4]
MQNAYFVELTIKRMKAAWAQKKRRMRSPGAKPYNFFMSKDVQKSLQLLAKKHGTSINKALEELILDQGIIIRHMEKRHREELKRAKEAPPRKRAGVGSRAERLRTISQSNDQQSSPPEQRQMSEKPSIGIEATEAQGPAVQPVNSNQDHVEPIENKHLEGDGNSQTESHHADKLPPTEAADTAETGSTDFGRKLARAFQESNNR